ncbi:MAG: RNA polymerase subunit sigma-24 [Gammaproteobacteria bacterium]|nr:RNA polymerase subunit sigma-24 [Gammaproteobacteria bacterium]OUU09762.1 MAG: hypothetical protein CBB94_06810 [Gammaproteobacteria bacterium TMED34]|tara:strand:+ start:376 stop:891 length:516 start_codon:yes stop_codon:yes gene_type:complete
MKNNDMRKELAQLGGGAHTLAIQILGNSDDAADAVHDAFVKVLARPEGFDRSRGALKPWFLRVVRNRCIDLLRKRPQVAELSDSGYVNSDPIDPGPVPDQYLEIQERDQQLASALTKLSVDQRQIVVLRDYLDLPYAEIADVLGTAPGTVMSRLHRARLALREALGGSDDE